MTKEEKSRRIDFKRKRFGVAKWHYQKLDCIDLYIELLALVNCKLIHPCRPCRHLLKFVLYILKNKWDNIRYIEFEEALHLANYLKVFVSSSVVLDHFKIHRKHFKKMINKARINKTPVEVIFENNFFFLSKELENIYLHVNFYIMFY